MSETKRVQGRWWIGTLHEPGDEHRTVEWIAEPERMQAYAGQIERCPTTGRLHLQFCVRFAKTITFATAKRLMPRAHLEICNSAKGAWDYCQKEDTRVEGPFVWGTPDLRSRKDEREVLRVGALQGKSFASVCDELDVSIYQVAQVRRAFDLLAEPYTGPLETIEFVYGASGAGKSHYVRERAKELGQSIYWYIPRDGTWTAVAPYRGEGVLVFNEFQDHSLSRSYCAWLKVLLDEGGCRYIDYKGAAAPLVCRHVFFVSQDVPPWELNFPDVMVRGAFLRRLSQFGKVIHAHLRTFTPIPLLSEAPWGPAEPVSGAAAGGGSTSCRTSSGVLPTD